MSKESKQSNLNNLSRLSSLEYLEEYVNEEINPFKDYFSEFDDMILHSDTLVSENKINLLKYDKIKRGALILEKILVSLLKKFTAKKFKNPNKKLLNVIPFHR